MRAVEAAEASALQAKRAVDASIISIGLSVLALFALLATILQGRMALKRATLANKIASDSAEKQLRAYLSVEPMGVTVPEKNRITFPLNVINHGATPASAIEFVSDFLVVEGEPREFDPKQYGRSEDHSLPSETMIGPGINQFVYATYSDDCLREHRTAIGSRKAAIVHYGMIRYDDVFGKSHVTNFSFYHWGEELSAEESKRCRFGNSVT
ncbi:hypothetical protein EYB45_07055 [Erythrobacteraceae bacterium CFH 75059]|nr:hypothetical protein EYB45_07055 [Erythrobacteraceae bacterium CFH 75059]